MNRAWLPVYIMVFVSVAVLFGIGALYKYEHFIGPLTPDMCARRLTVQIREHYDTTPARVQCETVLTGLHCVAQIHSEPVYFRCPTEGEMCLPVPRR